MMCSGSMSVLVFIFQVGKEVEGAAPPRGRRTFKVDDVVVLWRSRARSTTWGVVGEPTTGISFFAMMNRTIARLNALTRERWFGWWADYANVHRGRYPSPPALF